MTAADAAPTSFYDAARAVHALVAASHDPALITVAGHGGQMNATLTRMDPANVAAVGMGTILHALAEVGRMLPATLDAADMFAVAIPHRDIAYLLDANGVDATIALGPRPHDDSGTRAEVFDGLRAIAAAHPRHPAATRAPGAFAVLDHINPRSRPPTVPLPPPPSPGGHRHPR